MVIHARSITSLCFAAASALALARGVHAQSCDGTRARIVAGDAAIDDNFGVSLDLSGDLLVVGADQYHYPFTRSGVAYVFAREGEHWLREAKLVPSDGAAGDVFARVSISGGTVVVGAPFHDDLFESSGAAYVFVRDVAGWREQAKLVPSDEYIAGFFGGFVVISGETAFVSADGDDFFSGAVYVFSRNGETWTQQAKLTPSDPGGRGRFGSGLCVDGDRLLVGAFEADGTTPWSGAAYVFVRNGALWTEEAKLEADDGAQSDRFGYSVGLSGDTAVIGAPLDDDNGPNSGSAYVFVREASGWVQSAKLIASGTSGGGTGFSDSVAITGDTIVVASAGTADVATGVVYTFVREGAAWSMEQKLFPLDGLAGDAYGSSVFATEDTLWIGSPDSSVGAVPWSGAVYVVTRDREAGSLDCTCAAGPCGNADDFRGCANSMGRGTLLSATGSTSPDRVNFLVADARPGHFGVLVQGNSAVQLPFGDGFRCTGGSLVRISRNALLIGPNGSAAYGPCRGDESVSTRGAVVPGSGETRHYQFWYRDPGGPCGSGFNLSNGYEIVW